MKILVTGAAGFIGSKVCELLSLRGDSVVGLDNINDYYDVRLKYNRLEENGILHSSIVDNQLISSIKYSTYNFIKLSLEDRPNLETLFIEQQFDKVINLAAQAGVRYSITNPYAYVDSNLIGFVNIIECCRNNDIKHLVYASSSSVYGANSKVPFNEYDQVDTPVSLYAATKKANELIAHSYSHLYHLPTTGLRYFTVYGPWGRPDMAPMLFAKAISEGEPIKVFNEGELSRDFTYIDDIAKGTIQVLDKSPAMEQSRKPYKIYNIGCSEPVKLMDFITEIEVALNRSAEKIFLPMQKGDVYKTYADTTNLKNEIGYKPQVSLKEGISKFIRWYESEKNPLK